MQATLLTGTTLVCRRLKLARSKGQPGQAHKAPPGRLAPRPRGVQQAAQRRAVAAPASTDAGGAAHDAQEAAGGAQGPGGAATTTFYAIRYSRESKVLEYDVHIYGWDDWDECVSWIDKHVKETDGRWFHAGVGCGCGSGESGEALQVFQSLAGANAAAAEVFAGLAAESDKWLKFESRAVEREESAGTTPDGRGVWWQERRFRLRFLGEHDAHSRITVEVVPASVLP